MYYFVANLKNYTFFRGRGNRRFDSYLISIDHAASKSSLIRRVHQENRILVVDNGNVDMIRALIKKFANDANNLDKKRKKEEKALPVRYARPGDLSNSLCLEYKKLANRVLTEAEKNTSFQYVKSAISDQKKISPSYLIGMEDPTIAALTGLSIEPEYSLLGTDFYRSRIQRAVDFATNTTSGLYGSCPYPVFAGLHAIDYDTALLAGRLAANAGVQGIATGVVGALQDRNYIDYRIKDGTIIDLAGPLPRPYIRVLEILAGMHVGYASQKGHRPQLHVLGVGTPILFFLISLLGSRNVYLASDSTAPIVDAWISPTISLYVDKPAPLKLKAHKILQNWLEGGIGWECECPYCKEINRVLPYDIAAARVWWRNDGSPDLSKYSLYSDSPFSKWIPLLCRSSNPTVDRLAAMARINHNHWVLQRIEKQARKALEDPIRLAELGEETIKNYMSSSSSTPWNNAAYEAWQIAKKAVDDMKGLIN